MFSPRLPLLPKTYQRNPNQKCLSVAMINLVILTPVPTLFKMKARHKFYIAHLTVFFFSFYKFLYISELSLQPVPLVTLTNAILYLSQC